jgi:hemoglobin/transferrin/lactoferrin receptor protein
MLHPHLRCLVPTLLLLTQSMVSAEEVTAPGASPTVLPVLTVEAVTRLDTPLVEQPYAYYRTDREDLDRTNAATPVDALDHTPGVYVQKTASNQSSPYLRGLTGEQTLLMFDGVRLNHAMMRGGPNQYAALIPDGAVGAVDVLLGSSSTVQGTDGLTGTINFVQAQAGRQATTAASPWMSFREDTADGHTLAAGVDGRAGDFAYSVDGSRGWYHDKEGGRDAGDHLFGTAAGQNTIPNSGYDQVDGGARVAYTGLAANRFELSGGIVEQSDAPRPDGYFENSGTARNISRFYDPQIFQYVHARHILAPIGNAPRVQTTVYWHRQYEAQTRERYNTALTRYTRDEWEDEVATTGIDLQLTNVILHTHTVTYGGTYYEDRTSNSLMSYASPDTNPANAVFAPAASTPGLTTVPDGSSYHGMGIFVQDLWNIAPQWDVLAGARWSRFDWNADVTSDRPGYAAIGNTTVENDTQAVTGNLRLAYHPIDPSTLFAGVSQGFRAPNLSNLTGGQTKGSNNIQTEGNPDLDPERSLTYELGAKYEEQRDSAALTLFYTHLDSLIQTTYIDVNGDGVITSAGGDRAIASNGHDGQLAGFEFSHDWGVLPERLPGDQRVALINVVNATTGEIDVENAQGQIETQHISRANRVFGQTGVTYEPDLQWYVSLLSRWSMAYDEVNPGDANDVRFTTFQAKDQPAGAMPGYMVADLKAGWRSPGRNLRIDGTLENLLNHTYREVGSGTDGSGFAAVVRVTARY